MDPNAEWERWRRWLGSDDPESRRPTIYKQVVTMLAFRKVWRGWVAIVKNAPEEAKKYGLFHLWARWNYSREQGSAIRRQVEGGEGVSSIGALIQRVRRYPTILTRERFHALQHDDDLGVADEWFDKMAGTGDFINPEIPAADWEALRAKTAPVVKWVNTAVAHADDRRQHPEPPLDEIHDSIDAVVELFQKYGQLIRGVYVSKDPVMPPWPAVFRVAWIPDDEALQRVFKEIEDTRDEF